MKLVRGDFFLSPVFLVPLGLLLFNDLYLKINHPGYLSGILSDLAGMVFFPIFLVGVAEILSAVLPGRPYARPSWFIVAAVFVGVVFVVMKFSPAGEQAFLFLTEWLRQTLGETLGFTQRGLVADPLDLLALFLLPVPAVFGFRVRGNPPSAA